jgi:hypothetical protein
MSRYIGIVFSAIRLCWRYNWRWDLSFSFNPSGIGTPQMVLSQRIHDSMSWKIYSHHFNFKWVHNDLLQHTGIWVAINQFGTISSVIPWILWQFDSKFVPCKNPFWQNHVKAESLSVATITNSSSSILYLLLPYR